MSEGVEGNDATERAGVAAALVTRAIAEKARSGIIDDDDRFVAGTFAFVLSNYFSFLVAGSFELTSIRAMLKLLGADEFQRCFNTIQESYNRNAASKSVEAIGTTTEVWFKNPSPANFERLVQLFKLLRGHVSPNQDAIKPAKQQEHESRTFSALLHDAQLIPRYYRLIGDLISLVLDVPNLAVDNELKFKKSILSELKSINRIGDRLAPFLNVETIRPLMSPCAEISDLLVMKEGRLDREQLIGMLHVVRQAIADSEDFAGRIKKGF